jgi:hypothetical protein
MLRTACGIGRVAGVAQPHPPESLLLDVDVPTAAPASAAPESVTGSDTSPPVATPVHCPAVQVCPVRQVFPHAWGTTRDSMVHMSGSQMRAFLSCHLLNDAPRLVTKLLCCRPFVHTTSAKLLRVSAVRNGAGCIFVFAKASMEGRAPPNHEWL